MWNWSRTWKLFERNSPHFRLVAGNRSMSVAAAGCLCVIMVKYKLLVKCF
uniref:Uncharacterized protein n=1 Tax=Anguilla anguilla TaxID=7936 RepID=A0A0E9T2N4_ANGAN